MTREYVSHCKDVDITQVDVKKLVDIQDVKIEHGSPISVRMLSFLTQIKNPYCYLCGKTPVKIVFSDTDKEFRGALKSYLSSLALK